MEERNYEALKLEKQIAFPLYAGSRELIKLYKPYLDKLDVTYTQYITLLVLWEHRAMTVKALGEKLYLDSGTLTPLLKKLEQKGLVSRTRSTEDERNLIVSITEAADAMREEALQTSEEMERSLGISEKDREALNRIISRVMSKLDKH